MDFPHMREGRFPGTPQSVYEYQNDFVYTRWPKNVRINVLAVKWNSDYKDVPAFASVESRNAWLDAHASLEDSFVLQTMMRNVLDGHINLPIPYAVMCRYNYIFVDLPIATSAAEPIAYEGATGVRRYCYFVDEIQQAAPSTTKCRVTLDAWTTYINDLQVPYMQLKRGHAPMAAAAGVADYLANPLEHTDNLLADDVTFDDATVARHSHLINFGSAEKWVLFATTVGPAYLDTLASAPTGNVTPPEFYDVEQRDGYQLGVSGYEWNFGRNYTTQRAPATPWASTGGSVPNGYFVYAIEATRAALFFGDVADKCPGLLATIGGCFVLGANLFGRGTARSVLGHTIYDVIEQTASLEIALRQSDFGYPARYKGLTKLYTYPYAHLEASDNFGNTFEMRVESTSRLGLRCPVSLAFPYVYMQPFLVGANGEGQSSYTWMQLDGTTKTEDAYTSDISRYMWTWEIPTYAIMQEGGRDYAASNAASLEADRQAALNAYRATTRNANTGVENTRDSNATSVANTARSGDTSVANTARSGDTSVANTERSGETDVQTTNRSADTAIQNQDTSNNLAQRTRDLSNAKVYNECSTAQQVMASGLQADATAATNSLGLSMGTTIAGSAIAAATGGASVASMANAGLSSVNTTAQLGIALGKESAMVSAQSKATLDNADYANDNSQLVTTAANDASSEITERSTNTSRENAEDYRNTANTNASASASTANANAAASRDTSNANASASASTANANASASASTSNDNAGHSRDVTIDTAQRALRLAQQRAQAARNVAGAGKPVEYGAHGGDAMPDVMRRRQIQIRVCTQRPDAIAQAGDYFLRYGYASNRNWSVSDFCPMPHFCYWEATDATVVDGVGATNDVCLAIQDILEAGVTAWRDPDEIGRVTIYDN